MKFLTIYLNEIKLISIFHKTAMHVAIERGNPDIIKLILSRKEFDVNCKSILTII